MPNSAYIHIPFCAHKCDFCDFAAFAGLDHLSTEYCHILVSEIKERISPKAEKEVLKTIFFGGGTPGYIKISLLESIVEALNSHFYIDPEVEFTLETTPQLVSESNCQQWMKLGINRLSIGIESLNDQELVAIGRNHDKSIALESIKTAYDSGFDNIALDLMFGLPKQTLDSWESTLDELLETEPKHLSAYALTLANNSPLYKRYPLTENNYPEDETLAQMYEILLEKASQAGLRQYEISNFAQVGYESKHNLVYWRNQEYYAFGVSAHRFVDGIRSSNFRSLKKYMAHYLENENFDIIDDKKSQEEFVFLGLRLNEGLSLKTFQDKYGFNLNGKNKNFTKYLESGFLEIIDERLKLSKKGLFVSNSILAELI